MELLIDADALLCKRKLSLWTTELGTDLTLAVGGYVYGHELTSLSAELEPLRASGRLVVRDVLARTEAHAAYQALQREERLDKGEADAIAWAIHTPEERGPRWFVSLDSKARAVASSKGLRAVDVADTGALLVAVRRTSMQVMRSHLLVWDDVKNQFGRPRQWRTFDADFQGRVSAVCSRWPTEIAGG